MNKTGKLIYKTKQMQEKYVLVNIIILVLYVP